MEAVNRAHYSDAVLDYVKSFKLSSVVLKVTNRCNLKCSCCYWFKDKSAYQKPAFLSESEASKFVARLREYIVSSDITKFSIGLHGGEPLLWPTSIAEKFLLDVDRLKNETKAQIRLSIQTNATIINSKWLSLIKRHKISLGVSIDSSKESHDKKRVDFKGQGSFNRVKDFITILK